MRTFRARAFLLVSPVVVALLPLSAHAIDRCALDGQPIDLNNGKSTEGKTGMIHCTNDDGSPQRDVELRAGVQMGTMRYFQRGVLQKEFTTNARGNRDGVERTYAATPGPKNPLLREETSRDGTTIGVVRTWTADGTLARLGWHLDDGSEVAVASFTAQGKLSDLRCWNQPVFGADFDDASACGFRKSPATTELWTSKGVLAGRITFDRGERRHVENLWDNGKPQQVIDLGTASGGESDFAEDGVKRKAVAWIILPSGIAGKPGYRTVTLQQDFHESGTLVRERRWTPNGHGAELALDETWYLNGQLKTKDEFLVQDGQRVKRTTRYFDNGKVDATGVWLAKGDDDTHPMGVHQRFDADGRLRGESSYDARGRLTRERALDEAGTVVKDDQVFEDGSRKAFAK